MKGWLNDILGLAGTGLIGTGVWWMSPAWALVVVGIILLLLGTRFDIRQTKPVG